MPKIKKWLIYLSILGALIMLLDFFIPGSALDSTIIGVPIEEQYYYNAAQNSHNSYHVLTESNQFDITKEKASLFEKGQAISMRQTWLFKEVQSYVINDDMVFNLYSLRLYAGLFLPILILFVMGLALRLKKRVNTLTFVLQVILLADLIYLLQ